jgi:hypothetical protein
MAKRVTVAGGELVHPAPQLQIDFGEKKDLRLVLVTFARLKQLRLEFPRQVRSTHTGCARTSR